MALNLGETDSTVLPPTSLGAPIAPAATQKELISDEDALKLVNDTYADYSHGRKPFERQWYRNILFLLGNQWIVWDTLENKWRKKRLADWVPTPVTNKFASSGERLVSVLARIEPNWNYIPVSDSEKDIAASEMCKTAETIILEENKIQRIRESLSAWLVYTGNAYLLSGVEPVYAASPAETTGENEGFGANPTQGPDVETPEEEAGEPVPTILDYKLYTDVLSSFEVYLDQTIERFEDQIKVIVSNRRSKEYVKALWNVDVDEEDATPNIHYQESIGYVTSSPEITGFLASMSRIKRVTVKRLFAKPSKDYPQGLYIVVAGSKVVEKKALPTSADSVDPATGQTIPGEPFIPIAPMKFDNIPSAAFGRTPMDDIVLKQIQRNKIESLIELIALRMASPIWLMPEGTIVRNFSGAPGAVVTYNLVGDKSKEPSRIPGEQIPTSVVQFLNQIDKDIEELVSTFEALKGQAPYSGAPGIVIEQLVEQGLTRFGPALRNIAEGYRIWMKHQIEFFRKYGITEKTVMKVGEASKWDVTKFKGANIQGAVNVQVESDSTVPRSSQVEVAKILEAIDAKLIDVTDPAVRQKVLRKLKIEDLKDEDEGDMRRATQENELMAAGQQVQVTPFVDNTALHLYQHKKFANSDAGQAPNVKPLVVQHITQHNMIQDAMNNPGPAAPGAPGAGAPVGPAAGHVGVKGAAALNPGKGASPTLPPNIA